MIFRNLGEAIQAICRHVAKEYRDLHDWLFAVPLVHLLTRNSQPFSNSVLLMEKPKERDETWWGAEGFDTKSVRERTFEEQRYSCYYNVYHRYGNDKYIYVITHMRHKILS